MMAMEQVGGDHYKNLGIFQPWNVLKACMTPAEYRGYVKGEVIVYVMREAAKGGTQDLKKALHTLAAYIEWLEETGAENGSV